MGVRARLKLAAAKRSSAVVPCQQVAQEPNPLRNSPAPNSHDPLRTANGTNQAGQRGKKFAAARVKVRSWFGSLVRWLRNIKTLIGKCRRPNRVVPDNFDFSNRASAERLQQQNRIREQERAVAKSKIRTAYRRYLRKCRRLRDDWQEAQIELSKVEDSIAELKRNYQQITQQGLDQVGLTAEQQTIGATISLINKIETGLYYKFNAVAEKISKIAKRAKRMLPRKLMRNIDSGQTPSAAMQIPRNKKSIFSIFMSAKTKAQQLANKKFKQSIGFAQRTKPLATDAVAQGSVVCTLRFVIIKILDRQTDLQAIKEHTLWLFEQYSHHKDATNSRYTALEVYRLLTISLQKTQSMLQEAHKSGTLDAAKCNALYQDLLPYKRMHLAIPGILRQLDRRESGAQDVQAAISAAKTASMASRLTRGKDPSGQERTKLLSKLIFALPGATKKEVQRRRTKLSRKYKKISLAVVFNAVGINTNFLGALKPVGDKKSKYPAYLVDLLLETATIMHGALGEFAEVQSLPKANVAAIYEHLQNPNAHLHNLPIGNYDNVGMQLQQLCAIIVYSVVNYDSMNIHKKLHAYLAILKTYTAAGTASMATELKAAIINFMNNQEASDLLQTGPVTNDNMRAVIASKLEITPEMELRSAQLEQGFISDTEGGSDSEDDAAPASTRKHAIGIY